MKNESLIFSSFAQAEAATRREFLESITPGNLRRMCWFIAIYFPISLGMLIENLLVLRMGDLILWSIFDLALAVAFFCLAFFGNRHPGLWKPKQWVVRLYYTYCLISMTGYYFSIVPRFGDNPAFVLGVLMASLIFRLPPREFLPLLLVNQAVYIYGVLQLDRSSDYLLSAIVFGCDALFLGVLGAWTLFRSDWRNFQQQRALERANLELRQQAEEQNELMVITAHDLAGPLGSMQMLFDLVLQSPEWNKEPYRHVLKTSHESINPMQALISRLLEAHAAENPGQDSSLHPLDIQPCIDRALASVKSAANAKSIRLIYQEARPIPKVTGDPVLAQRALENLIFNAIKFSPPSSAVELAIHREANKLLIDVADEGPGVAAHDRDHLFRKFYKTSNKPTHGESSFGIGLFIVSKLMANQKGAATYHPRKPRGSIFRLTFEQARD